MPWKYKFYNLTISLGSQVLQVKQNKLWQKI